MLIWHVERLKKSRLLDDVVVATTLNPADDAIVDCCRKHRIRYFRGSEDDVLGRIAALISEFQVDVHVECFGDSPLTDAGILDEVVEFYLQHQEQYDFVSNSIKTTYPPGQEVLAYRGPALLEADSLVEKDDPLREHVSIHMIRRQERFRVHNLEAPPQYHYPEIYLEVDTPADFGLITNIITHFKGLGMEYFSLAEILDYLAQNQNLIETNSHVTRRWKQFRKE